MSAGVSVVWVGRRPAAPWEALAEEYATRIARFVPFEEVRVRPSSGRAHAGAQALAREAAAVLEHVSPGDALVALDEHGRQRTTLDFAGWLGRQRDAGRAVVFVVGSDLGLAEAIKVRAHERMSLSAMTLPHALARVLLLEQLYRAFDLLAGGRYHRGE